MDLFVNVLVSVLFLIFYMWMAIDFLNLRRDPNNRLVIAEQRFKNVCSQLLDHRRLTWNNKTLLVKLLIAIDKMIIFVLNYDYVLGFKQLLSWCKNTYIYYRNRYQ